MDKEKVLDILRDLWCYQKSERYTEEEIRAALIKAIEAVKRVG